MQRYRGPPSHCSWWSPSYLLRLALWHWLNDLEEVTFSVKNWNFWVFGTRVYAEEGRGPTNAWIQQYRKPPSLSLCRPWPLLPSIGSVAWSSAWSWCQISLWTSHFYILLSSSIREEKSEIPVLGCSTCWDFGVLRVDRRRDDQSSSNPETRVRKSYGCVQVLGRWSFTKIDGNDADTSTSLSLW